MTNKLLSTEEVINSFLESIHEWFVTISGTSAYRIYYNKETHYQNLLTELMKGEEIPETEAENYLVNKFENDWLSLFEVEIT